MGSRCGVPLAGNLNLKFFSLVNLVYGPHELKKVAYNGIYDFFYMLYASIRPSLEKSNWIRAGPFLAPNLKNSNFFNFETLLREQGRS